ncbi:MAG: inorganic phosphate transporter [Lentisphaeria bacterium]|nr:inorganic phosphate transporter [Lentisphaeria bacterium]
MIYLLFMVAIFLAYANGANDNFKGVATVYGSKTLSYKKSLAMSSIATFLGSICSIFFASALVKVFSAKGLVPLEIASNTSFLIAVAIAAATTVMIATISGLPISTTHSIIGALIGAGFIYAGENLNFSTLGNSFLIPLLVSPFIAFALIIAIQYCRKIWAKIVLRKLSLVENMSPQDNILIDTMNESYCLQTLEDNPGILSTGGSIAGNNLTENPEKTLLGRLHIFSAFSVCFARSLNDTPKIAGLILIIELFDIELGVFVLGLAMLIGGIIQSRKVAETISNKITQMDEKEAFSANVVTAFLVIIASKLGMPVSTTHVSSGSIFALGISNGKANKAVILKVILSWLITLPLAAIIALSISMILK